MEKGLQSDGSYISETGKIYKSKEAYDMARKQKNKSSSSSQKKQFTGFGVQPSSLDTILRPNEPMLNPYIGFDMSSEQIANGVLHALTNSRLINSTSSFPGNRYNLTNSIGLDFNILMAIGDEMISKIYSKPDCARKMKTYFGTNWPKRVYQALFNEMSRVLQFIELSRQKQIPPEGYANFIGQLLTIGARRLLDCEMADPAFSSLGFENGTLIVKREVTLRSQDLLTFVTDNVSKDIVNPDLLPTFTDNSYCPISNDDLITFSTIKESFTEFLFRPWNITETKNTLCPWGNANVINSEQSTYILDDGSASSNRMNIAFNNVYSTVTTGNTSIFGIPLYKKVSMLPNFVEFRVYWLYIWTGILGGTPIYTNSGTNVAIQTSPHSPSPLGPITNPPVSNPPPSSPVQVVTPDKYPAPSPTQVVTDIISSTINKTLSFIDQIGNNPLVIEAIKYKLQNRPQEVYHDLGISGEVLEVQLPLFNRFGYKNVRYGGNKFGP